MPYLGQIAAVTILRPSRDSPILAALSFPAIQIAKMLGKLAMQIA